MGKRSKEAQKQRKSYKKRKKYQRAMESISELTVPTADPENHERPAPTSLPVVTADGASVSTTRSSWLGLRSHDVPYAESDISDDNVQFTPAPSHTRSSCSAKTKASSTWSSLIDDINDSVKNSLWLFKAISEHFHPYYQPRGSTITRFCSFETFSGGETSCKREQE